MTPTGSQAGYDIEKAVSEMGDKFPSAIDCLINRRYVDDLAPGAQSRDAREGQEQDCMKLLSSIGLKFKYIVRSGENPCEKASSDGQSVKLLGYKWYPETDTISPGFSELNLNPKVRCAKKTNLLPVVTREDALQLLESIQITKRIAVSKISELYDRVGLFEPEDVMIRYETSTIKQSLKPEKLTQFKEHQGILYYQSRITEENPFRTEDLDDVPFLDIHEFTSLNNYLCSRRIWVGTGSKPLHRSQSSGDL